VLYSASAGLENSGYTKSPAMAHIDDVLYGKGRRAMYEKSMPYDEVQRLSFKTTQEVMCTIQNSSIIISVVVVSTAVISLRFVLVPLIMAYFVTFLMAPMMDFMEKRPYDGIPKMVLCKDKYADDFWWAHDGESYFEKLPADYDVEGVWQFPDKEARADRQRMTQTQWDEAKDRAALEGLDELVVGCTTAVKFPHMAACAFTLIGWIAIAYGVIALLVDNLEAFTAADRHDACRNTPGWEDYDKSVYGDPGKQEENPILECDECSTEVGAPGFWLGASDPRLTDPLKACRCCTSANVPSDKVDPTDDKSEDIKTTGDRSVQFMWTKFLNDQMDYLETDMGVFVYKELDCPSLLLDDITVNSTISNGYVDFVITGVDALKSQMGTWETKTERCSRQAVFPRNPDGQTWEEFSATIGVFGTFISDLILVLMLAVFILLERPEGRTITGDHIMMMQIEDMVKNYISLKTLLSMVTGILVAISLTICNVKMAMIFGFLSFALNFIPMVGSMIAIVLPIPLVILDENVVGWQKTLAILLPSAVQGYVGNFLEPAVFGASLNLTAIAVLLGLVVFAVLWGIPGAILSVPLLGATKIVLHHTDHPIAKYFLKLIRENGNMP
jgi:predicted PurR-regulated permease PerM